MLLETIVVVDSSALAAGGRPIFDETWATGRASAPACRSRAGAEVRPTELCLHRTVTADRRFGASYSRCRRYRYLLWREWSGGRGVILWVMLNPSTADHLGNNDPTIARCERRSVAWGYRRMEVVNLFALRAPKPAALRVAEDPIGPKNDRHVARAAAGADVIVCAWGNHGLLHDRATTVRALLAGRPLSCLGTTLSGQPAHPLYLPFDRGLAEYPAAPG